LSGAMAEPRLGAKPIGKLGGKLDPVVSAAKPGIKLDPDVSATKLGGKLAPYVPRGAQYDYNPPSVFARYKVLTAVFVILLVSLFGYWVFILRQPGAARPPRQEVPQSDPIYIEPLTPK